LKRLLFALTLLTALAGCAHVPTVSLPVREYATLPLPFCQPEMDSPDFWTGKLADPDQPLLTPRQIAELNRLTLRCGQVADVFSNRIWNFQLESQDQSEFQNSGATCVTSASSPLVNRGRLDAYTLFTYLKDETERIKGAPRLDAGGNTVPAEFYAPLDANLNLNGIHDANPVHYGLTRQRTDVRYYPTRFTLASRRSELEFDILQVSSLQALQPVAILHTSQDGKWLFVIAPYCQGWVWTDDLIYDLTPAEIAGYLNPKERLVVVGHASTAVWQPGDTTAACRFYMGASLPLLGENTEYFQIGLPERDVAGRLAVKPAYVSRQEAVQKGFLACTPRNILTQAFRMLHTPYSWGGKGEYRDCSQLVMDVFATMGLALPRNSASQGAVGSKRIRFGRGAERAQRTAQLNRLQAPALLQFPGHIMLYLGRDGGHYYAIHDIWSWRKPDLFAPDRAVIIGQVVVSDLSLGEGSKRGSLLERLTTINYLQP
jgi:hypothetical protein